MARPHDPKTPEELDAGYLEGILLTYTSTAIMQAETAALWAIDGIPPELEQYYDRMQMYFTQVTLALDIALIKAIDGGGVDSLHVRPVLAGILKQPLNDPDIAPELRAALLELERRMHIRYK